MFKILFLIILNILTKTYNYGLLSNRSLSAAADKEAAVTNHPLINVNKRQTKIKYESERNQNR
jgi:hypothetical protein